MSEVDPYQRNANFGGLIANELVMIINEMSTLAWSGNSDIVFEFKFIQIVVY